MFLEKQFSMMYLLSANDFCDCILALNRVKRAVKVGLYKFKRLYISFLTRSVSARVISEENKPDVG